jgi:hypothetical protein
MDELVRQHVRGEGRDGLLEGVDGFPDGLVELLVPGAAERRQGAREVCDAVYVVGVGGVEGNVRRYGGGG